MATGTITTVRPTSSLADESFAMFDLARWKPCTAEEYLRDISRVAADSGEDGFDTATLTLPDGRTRLVVEAEVVALGPAGSAGSILMEPYLTVLFDPENGKPMAFRRTDVILAMDHGRIEVSRGRDRN